MGHDYARQVSRVCRTQCTPGIYADIKMASPIAATHRLLKSDTCPVRVSNILVWNHVVISQRNGIPRGTL